MVVWIIYCIFALNIKTYKMTKTEIREFLKEWADEVYDMPGHALELLMDDHSCIRWYGKEYFIQDNNSFYSDFEEEVKEHLTDKHII